MLEVKKTTNVSGFSRVSEGGEPYVYFSATINEDGKSNIAYAIQNE